MFRHTSQWKRAVCKQPYLGYCKYLMKFAWKMLHWIMNTVIINSGSLRSYLTWVYSPIWKHLIVFDAKMENHIIGTNIFWNVNIVTSQAVYSDLPIINSRQHKSMLINCFKICNYTHTVVAQKCFPNFYIFTISKLNMYKILTTGRRLTL